MYIALISVLILPDEAGVSFTLGALEGVIGFLFGCFSVFNMLTTTIVDDNVVGCTAVGGEILGMVVVGMMGVCV